MFVASRHPSSAVKCGIDKGDAVVVGNVDVCGDVTGVMEVDIVMEI